MGSVNIDVGFDPPNVKSKSDGASRTGNTETYERLLDRPKYGYYVDVGHNLATSYTVLETDMETSRSNGERTF